MNWTGKLGACAAAGVLTFGAGLVTGLRWKRPARTEPPAPAQRQQDGSLILERDPKGKVDVPIIPKGATLERAVTITVQSHGASDAVTPLTTGAHQQDAADLRPGFAGKVRINLALVRMSDNTMRVIASSPDGEVVGGLDVPVSPAPVQRAPRWTTSALYSQRGNVGGMVQRDLSIGSVGIGAINGMVWVQAGIRF